MRVLCLLVQAAVAVSPAEAHRAAPLAASSKTVLIKTAEEPAAPATEPARAEPAQSAAENALDVVKQHWVTTAQATTGAKNAASQITDISGKLLNKYGKPEEPPPPPPKPVSFAGAVATLAVGLLVA